MFTLLLGILLSGVLNIFGVFDDGVPYSEVVSLFRNEQVKSFKVQDQTIYMELYNPYQGKLKISATLAGVESFRQETGAIFAYSVGFFIMVSLRLLHIGQLPIQHKIAGWHDIADLIIGKGDHDQIFTAIRFCQLLQAPGIFGIFRPGYQLREYLTGQEGNRHIPQLQQRQLCG